MYTGTAYCLNCSCTKCIAIAVLLVEQGLVAIALLMAI